MSHPASEAPAASGGTAEPVEPLAEAGPTRPGDSAAARVGIGALTLLPGALTVYLSFQSGGFFAGTVGIVAAVLGVALVLRITLANDPFAGLSRLPTAILAALGLLAAWTLLSFLWSGAAGRAVLEFDRALMYWLALLLFASVPWRRRDLERALLGVFAAIVAVAGAALITRVLPEVWETHSAVENMRLSYPLTYWNALGLLAAIGIVLATHLSASERQPPALRIAGAATLPVLAATLYFTFSRGAIVAACAGVVAYVAVARPRGLPAALLSAGTGVAIALVAAYRADLLASDDPASVAAVAQGHSVAVALAVAVAVAATLRFALLKLDRRVAAIRPPSVSGRAIGAWTAGVALVALLAFVAAGGPSAVADRYERFASKPPTSSGDLRTRLASADNNGRAGQWRVALDAFAAEPLVGHGAATFPLIWARDRDDLLKVEDGHSLYLETLAELGLVGIVLLALTLAGMLGGLWLRARRRASDLHAALLAAGIAWALHAGIDWDWEMPAVTLWLFALGGAALAARPATVRVLPRLPRLVLGVWCLALIALPALVASSQAQLDRAVDAFKRGDCATAIDASLAANDALPVRPDPFAVMGFCDVRLGEPDLGVAALRAAVDRDPDNWQLRYGLALVQAAAGQDPRPELRRARRLNPREPLVLDALDAFDEDSPRAWQREARRIQLPIL